MSHIHDTADRPKVDHSNVRLRRLLFRSWHRGTQESDLILGTFAECSLGGFDAVQLDRFEALLECSDAELFDWIIGGGTPPPRHDHDVVRRLRDFCARPGPIAQPSAHPQPTN